MKTTSPKMTVTLGALTVVSYLAVSTLHMGDLAAMVGGFIPARLSGAMVTGALPLVLTPLSATLLHAGLLHLGFNLLMLFYCGREDEVALGRAGVLSLFIGGAYAAALAQYVVGPHSMTPMIGASGAISALVGAYAILYGQRLPSRFSPEVARWLHVAWLAAAWIAVQLLLGIASRTEGVAIAAAAHIGGFIAGLLLARPMLRWHYRKA
ncbi:rhomboid family intramembrane serine protease [uncultured Sphingomonas sp.]|uniref:rhomboid family intramembrane serine protease n=1 Tax=uncultured Sphingomonas sp. TaxID=158754 RepID=UPI0025E93EE6|nr:rhomboid family intramembrane serine protease [uncultured Sphingomonas sp.]